jgi:methylated-DNA-[protein]-cysteine S-methyltransferase
MKSAQRGNRSVHRKLVSRKMASPVGELTLVASNDGLAAILWENDSPRRVPLDITTRDDAHPLLTETERQLNEYFAGRRKSFDLRLDFVGTEFQKKVWRALLTIPYGETRSYAQIAEQIGNPPAVRAVGAANGRNPISIVTPCHRVIGSNGTLTGFAGGMAAKALLLELEGRGRDDRAARPKVGATTTLRTRGSSHGALTGLTTGR